jgi:hypothetical protein
LMVNFFLRSDKLTIAVTRQTHAGGLPRITAENFLALFLIQPCSSRDTIAYTVSPTLWNHRTIPTHGTPLSLNRLECIARVCISRFGGVHLGKPLSNYSIPIAIGHSQVPCVNCFAYPAAGGRQ